LKGTATEEKVRLIAERFLEGLGMELVDVSYVSEYGRKVLRLLADKPGGITLDDLTSINREFGALLDVEGAFSERYTLEVSSPGLDRPLFKEKDYVRFAGKKANIKTKAPIDGRRNFKALLMGVEGGAVKVKDADGREFAILLSNIDKARLVPEF
jgi:ribosome maturation factor RimP